jgi:hypothetical protein
MLDKTIFSEKLKFKNHIVNRKGLGLTWGDQAPSFGDCLSYKKKGNVGGII